MSMQMGPVPVGLEIAERNVFQSLRRDNPWWDERPPPMAQGFK